MNKDGIFFEIGEQYEDDDDEFPYSSFVQYSNDEMLEMLNMNDFDDEEEGHSESIAICSLSFEKLRAKMEALTPDGKVSRISHLL